MYPSPVVAREHGKVYRVTAGAAGATLALVSDTIDGEVRVLDALTLELREKILLGALRTPRACALAPDDRALLVATADDVTLFDLHGRAVRWTVPLAGDEGAATFSPDGTNVAVGRAEGSLALLDVSNGRELAALPCEGEPRAAVWDAHGLAVLAPTELVLSGGAVPPRRVRPGPDDGEASELCAVDNARVAVAGASGREVWCELRARGDGARLAALRVEGDRRAEGLAFVRGVLFLATDGGVYRADPPHEQFVRWLPPLGGPHDPTRLAALAGGLVAVSARDVRVFRASS